MTVEQLPSVESDTVALDFAQRLYSSTEWLLYFQNNKNDRVDFKFAHNAIPLAIRAPLIRSLQRFQIGETGEGKHLRKYASTTGDQDYMQCIDLFIKEEQYHATVLAQMIQCMDGELLNWHWSDIAFIGLRRMLGLKTELFILLIAEIIGKCFYKACANGMENARIRDAFSLIVLDEIGHLEFHCEFMNIQMKALPGFVRQFTYFMWCILFFTACLVFIADHIESLNALKVAPRDFLNDCARTFYRAAGRIGLTNIKEN